MPFLVDSTTMELSGQGAGIHLLVHPVIRVRRNGDGELAAVLAADAPDEDGVLAESFIRVEIDRVSAAPELQRLRERLLDVLRQVAAAVEDWAAMRGRAAELIAELRDPPPSLDRGECEEAAALLEWLDGGHFTFLGYAEYELVMDNGDGRLRRVADSALGILRERPAGARRGEAKLSARASALARQPHPLLLTKANSRSTVHRPAYLDYVGVRRFGPDGEVVGERRFLGLYTTAAYRAAASEIPVVRRKVEAIVARAGFTPASHAEKALVETLDTYPRDELFQIPEDELFELAMGIVALGERQRVRLFTRRDPLDRFVSCLVFLPRDRFNTRNRERVQEILGEAFDAERIDFELRLSESVLVRLHFTVRLRPGHVPDHDPAEIEARIAEATGSWTDELREALLAEAGEEQGTALYRRYGDAFPAGYRDEWIARSAVVDIHRIEQLAEGEQLAVSLYHPLEAGARSLRCKLYHRGESLTLSDVLPMFESMGLRVRDERPHEVTPRDAPTTWIYDFGVEYAGDGELAVDEVRERFQDAFTGVWRGDVESDGFNALVLRAGLDRRDVTVLRAIARYLRQARVAYSERYMEQALLAHPDVAAALVELFRARFDPDRDRTPESTDAVARKDRGGDRRRRQPRRGPHPAQLPRGRAGDAADQPLPARRGRRTQAVPVVQARSRAGAAAARSAPALRDLRLLAARRGRAPARRRGRPRRPALVRSPRGLPDGDPRPDEGADGQERADRARRRQGRLRGQAAARGPRAAGRRGGRLLPDLHQRPARPVRHRARGSGDAAAARRAPRRRRPVPRRRRGQGHGDVLGHRQRDRGGVRLLARRRLRVRRLGRLRPQGDGDHGAQRLGVGQAPLPRARDRHAEQRLHRRGDRRHVGRRVRQRHAAVAAHQARRRVRPPSRVRRPRPRPGGVLRRAAPAVRAAALLVGRLRPLADLRGRRRLAAHREVDHGVGGGAEGARDRGRPAHAVGADPRAAARPGRPAVERRDRDLRQGREPRATPTSATRPTTPSASTPASCAAASSGRAATSASRSAAASSTRWPAGRSTPTRSTTPAA